MGERGAEAPGSSVSETSEPGATVPLESDRERFLSAEFRTVTTLDALPAAAREQLAAEMCEGALDSCMASAGEPFAAGCVSEWGTPHKRLILAGLSEELWFACYERGGVAYGRHLIVFEPSATAPLFTSEMPIQRDVPLDLAAIKEAVRSTSLRSTAQRSGSL